VSRRDAQWLADVEDACLAIQKHLSRGEIGDGLIFDAVCMRIASSRGYVLGALAPLHGARSGLIACGEGDDGGVLGLLGAAAAFDQDEGAGLCIAGRERRVQGRHRHGERLDAAGA
jgi:hypothetical protein